MDKQKLNLNHVNICQFGQTAGTAAAVYAFSNLGYGEPGYVSRGYDGMGRLGTPQKRRRHWRKAIVLVLLLLLLYLFRTPLLTAVGSALIAQDPPQHGDVIVVLMGAVPDRIVQSVELYREGLAENIVMVRSHDFTSFELVEVLALEIPGMADINRDIALQLGVPQEHILILEGRADSTRDEALVVQDYLQAHGMDSLLLVTSRYHSMRAKKTFEQVLGSGYQVVSLPSPYDPYDPQNWWTQRRQMRDVFFEYQKLVNLYLFKK